MCAGGPGACKRAAKIVNLELLDSVAEVTMLWYVSDQNVRLKTVFKVLVMRLMCLLTAKLSWSSPRAVAGRYLKPVRNFGKANACKHIHSPSSDHLALEAKYVWQPMLVGVHLKHPTVMPFCDQHNTPFL